MSMHLCVCPCTCVCVSECTYVQYRKTEAIRVCLKHLRQYNYNEAYDTLRKKACVELEHAKLSALHQKLVRMVAHTLLHVVGGTRVGLWVEQGCGCGWDKGVAVGGAGV